VSAADAVIVELPEDLPPVLADPACPAYILNERGVGYRVPRPEE
jgi:hypothetical protein